MNTKVNAYDALIRRLEMTLARQKLAMAETELQLEAARSTRDDFVKVAQLVPGKAPKAGAPS